MKIGSRAGFVCFVLAAIACLLTANAFAQYQGIWKDNADPPSHNFYIKHYSTGSTVVIYTEDAVVFYAFLADISNDTFEATSMDYPDESKTLSITFISSSHAVVGIKDNITQATTNTNIEKKYAAVRTMHSGIWKDATSVFSMYVQDYATGSSVIVYTFDGVTFQAYLGDISMFLFAAVNMADQSEELDMVFTEFDKGTVTVLPAVAPTYLPAARNFSYELTKTYSPATLDVDFQCAPTSGSPPLEVQFTDTSTIDFTGWNWEFGDGRTSTEQDPEHTYNQPGTYKVVVTMSAPGLSYACIGSESVNVQGAGSNPAISGRITLSPSGTGLDGVTMTADNGGGSTTTNSSGDFSLTVTSGWSGTLTPSLTGYTFTPSSKTFSNVTANQNQNFTATSGSSQSVSISGVITASGAGLSGVTVTVSTGGSTATNSSGSYSLTVTSGWSGTITPSLTGYTFTPSSKSFANITTSQTQNFTAASQLQYVSVSGTVTDGQAGLQWVEISLQGYGTTSTDAQGNWSTQVPYGWGGAISASLADYTFVPVEISLGSVTSTTTGVDFTGTPSAQYVSVSGTVTNGQTGLQWVEITLEGYGTTWTDAQGNWSTQVPYAWGGAISASLLNYTFIPVEISLGSVTSATTGVDFTGTPVQTDVTLSGTVTAQPADGGQGIGGVTISYTGDSASGTTTTDGTGAYSFTVPSGWTGYAAAIKDGWTFQPPSIGYSSQTTDSVQGYTGLADVIIAGTILADQSYGGFPMNNVEVVFTTAGGGVWSVITDDSGHYSSTVPYGWAGGVVPSLTNWSFHPAWLNYSGLTEDHFNDDFEGY